MIARLPASSANIGKTVYCVFRHPDATVWDDANEAFEAWAAASWADYQVSATETGGVGASGEFTVTVPPAVAAIAGWTVDWFEDQGLDHLDPLIGVGSGSGSSGTVPAIAGTAGTITIPAARLWVRGHAHSGGDSTEYSDTDIDRAIQLVGGRFCRETRALRGFETLALTDGDAEVDFSSIGDFRPDRLIAAYAEGYEEPLALTDYGSLRRLSVQDPSEGDIEAIAFKDADNAVVWRLPNDDLDLDVEYWRPFSSWTPGTDPGGVLNLQDDWLHPILVYGASAVLQHAQPEKLFASASWREYLKFESEMRNVGNLAAKTSRRSMASF